MKLIGQLKCPECGEDIQGTVDLVPGVALMTVAPDGAFEWDGETKMTWDGQSNWEDHRISMGVPPSTPKRMWRVTCANAHEWLVEVQE